MIGARLMVVTAMFTVGGCCSATEARTSLETWTLWEAYAKYFIAEDGRVIDHTGGGHSTSEGQAYALFLALVAGDRATFARVLEWTAENLAGGDLGAHLPAWKWGQARDGAWRPLDDNSASDADIWLAYTLAEAGRLWCVAEYLELARQVASNAARDEVADLPGLGPTLLPGRRGFQIGEAAWRLNPSYLAIPILRGLAADGLPGPWAEVADTSVRIIEATSRDGFVPDWVVYSPQDGFRADTTNGRFGSYDAIRVYLWAGVIAADDGARAVVAEHTGGLLRHWRAEGYVPETVAAGDPPRPGPRAGPPGFYAALLPELCHVGSVGELGRIRAALESTRRKDLYGMPPAYYDQNLVLFGEGYLEGRYRFAADGRLEPRWVLRCTLP